MMEDLSTMCSTIFDYGKETSCKCNQHLRLILSKKIKALKKLENKIINNTSELIAEISTYLYKLIGKIKKYKNKLEYEANELEKTQQIKCTKLLATRISLNRKFYNIKYAHKMFEDILEVDEEDYFIEEPLELTNMIIRDSNTLKSVASGLKTKYSIYYILEDSSLLIYNEDRGRYSFIASIKNLKSSILSIIEGPGYLACLFKDNLIKIWSQVDFSKPLQELYYTSPITHVAVDKIYVITSHGNGEIIFTKIMTKETYYLACKTDIPVIYFIIKVPADMLIYADTDMNIGICRLSSFKCVQVLNLGVKITKMLFLVSNLLCVADISGSLGVYVINSESFGRLCIREAPVSVLEMIDFGDCFISILANGVIEKWDSRTLELLCKVDDLCKGPIFAGPSQDNMLFIRDKDKQEIRIDIKTMKIDTESDDRKNTTCLEADSNFLYVGTAFGYVFVYKIIDFSLSCLLNSQMAGPIKSLHLSLNMLICHGSAGQVSAWSLGNLDSQPMLLFKEKIALLSVSPYYILANTTRKALLLYNIGRNSRNSLKNDFPNDTTSVFINKINCFVGYKNGKIIMWNIQTQIPDILNCDGEEISALSGSPSGRVLISGTATGTILIWDMSNCVITQRISIFQEKIVNIFYKSKLNLMFFTRENHKKVEVLQLIHDNFQEIQKFPYIKSLDIALSLPYMFYFSENSIVSVYNLWEKCVNKIINVCYSIESVYKDMHLIGFLDGTLVHLNDSDDYTVVMMQDSFDDPILHVMLIENYALSCSSKCLKIWNLSDNTMETIFSKHEILEKIDVIPELKSFLNLLKS